MRVWMAAIAVVAASSLAAQTRYSYSRPQADRGAALYATRCASCHGEEAQGDGNGITPPLFGLEFRANWGGVPLSVLLDRIRTESEQGQPSALSRSQQADVLAFILARNGVAPGDADLPSDPALLGAVLVSSLIRD